MQNEDIVGGVDKVQGYRLAEFCRPSFSQAEVLSATGLSEKTIQNYLARYEEEMHLSAPAPGKGRSRLYSAADAVFLAAVRAISAFGLAPSTAIFLAHHVRPWALAQAQHYYQNGFVHLPDRLFGFCPPFRASFRQGGEGNDSNLIIHAATFDEIQAWAKEYGHPGLLVIDGARIARETINKLWARYEMVEINNPNDPACWEKARFKPAEEE